MTCSGQSNLPIGKLGALPESYLNLIRTPDMLSQPTP